MMVAIALSIRLMGVRALYAYPLALAFIATYPGRESLASSYPLAGLLLAAAWYFRRHPVIAGTSLGLLGGLRGYGLIPLFYPLIKRQWQAILWAVGLLLALLAVTIVLEPGIISDFQSRGMPSADLWIDFPDNSGLPSVVNLIL